MNQVRISQHRAATWLGLLTAVFMGIPAVGLANPRLTTSEALPRRIADGFDFPVGSSGDANGYYTARSMTPYYHMGDDWNGVGGGNSDLGDPIYAIADGLVVYSYNYGSDWGEVIIIRHKYINKSGQVDYVDSLYGHVQNRRVRVGQHVRRGKHIAEIGNNRGMYMAHLHLEIRKNIDIGIQTWRHSKSAANYLVPKAFIAQHRPGSASNRNLLLANRSSKGHSQDKPGYDRSLRVLMDRQKKAEKKDEPVMELAKNDVSRAMLLSNKSGKGPFAFLASAVSETTIAMVPDSGKSVPNRIRTSRTTSSQGYDKSARIEVIKATSASQSSEEEETERKRLLGGLFSKSDPEPQASLPAKEAPQDAAQSPGGLFARKRSRDEDKASSSRDRDNAVSGALLQSRR